MTPPPDAVGALSESRAGLGALVTRLLEEHWPDSGVNGWYLTDLLRDAEVGFLAPVVAENATLRAQVEAVKALLADEWVYVHPSALYPEGRRVARWPRGLQEELRAALSSPTPETDEAGGGS